MSDGGDDDDDDDDKNTNTFACTSSWKDISLQDQQNEKYKYNVLIWKVEKGFCLIYGINYCTY